MVMLLEKRKAQQVINLTGLMVLNYLTELQLTSKWNELGSK
jgi:hypothetical protein